MPAPKPGQLKYDFAKNKISVWLNGWRHFDESQADKLWKLLGTIHGGGAEAKAGFVDKALFPDGGHPRIAQRAGNNGPRAGAQRYTKGGKKEAPTLDDLFGEESLTDFLPDTPKLTNPKAVIGKPSVNPDLSPSTPNDEVPF